MKLLCRMYGHAQPESGWWGDALYGEVRGGKVDGIGRTHFQIELTCPRCREKYVAARFHGTDPKLRDPRIMTALADAQTALITLCARYGYEPDGVTPNDWSEWQEARRVHMELGAILAVKP